MLVHGYAHNSILIPITVSLLLNWPFSVDHLFLHFLCYNHACLYTHTNTVLFQPQLRFYNPSSWSWVSPTMIRMKDEKQDQGGTTLYHYICNLNPSKMNTKDFTVMWHEKSAFKMAAKMAWQPKILLSVTDPDMSKHAQYGKNVTFSSSPNQNTVCCKNHKNKVLQKVKIVEYYLVKRVIGNFQIVKALLLHGCRSNT